MDNSPKLLIIEDNVELVEIYKIKFTHEGFTVFTAADGEEGILKAVQEKPDIILLDIYMPNMDGWQVLRALRNNTSLTCKIVILSNLGQQENIDKAYQLGADAYLVKADHIPAEVVAKVKEFVQISSRDSYLVQLLPGHYDYDKFVDGIPEAAKAGTCIQCGGEVVLQLLPDKMKLNGTWWNAHYVCTKCGKEY